MDETWPATGRAPASAATADPADALGFQLQEGGSVPQKAALQPPPLPKVKPRRPAPPPPAARDGAPVVETPEMIVGLSENEVEALLGPPQHATTAPPARIRDYEDAGCRLRLYLYVDLKTELYRVLHIETLPVAQNANNAERCLTRLVQRVPYSREP